MIFPQIRTMFLGLLAVIVGSVLFLYFLSTKVKTNVAPIKLKDAPVRSFLDENAQVAGQQCPLAVKQIMSRAELLFPKARRDTWEVVDEVSRDFVFFSNAYLDERRQPRRIRVFGFKRTRKTFPGYCHVWRRSGQGTGFNFTTVKAVVAVIPEGHATKYVPAIVDCPLKNQTELERPEFISFVYGACDSPLHVVPVVRMADDRQTRDFTVCLSPLHNNYADVNELVSCVEMNRILGAKFFTIYNHNSTKEVSDVLEVYRRNGIAEIVDWSRFPLAADKESEVHYYGQTIAINDCLYRNMFKTQFGVFSDLDEILTPRMNDSWMDLLSTLSAGDPKTLEDTASFVFLNTFFWKEWPDDIGVANLSNTGVAKKIPFLMKTKRQGHIYKKDERSKYIANGRLIEYVRIHLPKMFSGTEKVVPSSSGLVYHYRKSFNPPTTDRRLHHFAADLVQRVASTLDELEKTRSGNDSVTKTDNKRPDEPLKLNSSKGH